jgi:hypothetical protein
MVRLSTSAGKSAGKRVEEQHNTKREMTACYFSQRLTDVLGQSAKKNLCPRALALLIAKVQSGSVHQFNSTCSGSLLRFEAIYNF